MATTAAVSGEQTPLLGKPHHRHHHFANYSMSYRKLSFACLVTQTFMMSTGINVLGPSPGPTELFIQAERGHNDVRIHILVRRLLNRVAVGRSVIRSM